MKSFRGTIEVRMSNDPEPPSPSRRQELDLYVMSQKRFEHEAGSLFLILQGIHATSIDALSDEGDLEISLEHLPFSIVIIFL